MDHIDCHPPTEHNDIVISRKSAKTGRWKLSSKPAGHVFFLYAIGLSYRYLDFFALNKTVIRLREFLRDKPRVSFVFAVLVGILVLLCH